MSETRDDLVDLLVDAGLASAEAEAVLERAGVADRRVAGRRASGRVGGRRRTDKVACPGCGWLQSDVIQHEMTAAEQMTEGYWRRRVCARCRAVFPTIELVGNVEDYLST